MTQSYAKAQSNARATGTPSDPKDTIRVAAYSSTSKKVDCLKTNDDGTFMLDEFFYPLKAFVPEEIILVISLKFLGMHNGRRRWIYH